MAKKKSAYGYQTIGSLIELLKKAVEETPYLNYNSPVLISDYNMSGYKYEFDVLPAFSYQHYTAGVCLFHSLGETVEEVVKEPVKKEVKEAEDASVVKFAKWVKN